MSAATAKHISFVSRIGQDCELGIGNPSNIIYHLQGEDIQQRISSGDEDYLMNETRLRFKKINYILMQMEAISRIE